MENFYFTFGSAHAHPNGFVKINAESYQEARSKMFDKFGAVWAFQYDEKDWINDEGISQQEEYNLKEITK